MLSTTKAAMTMTRTTSAFSKESIGQPSIKTMQGEQKTSMLKRKHLDTDDSIHIHIFSFMVFWCKTLHTHVHPPGDDSLPQFLFLSEVTFDHLSFSELKSLEMPLIFKIN